MMFAAVHDICRSAPFTRSTISLHSSAAFVVASSIKAAARKPQSEITPETPPQVQPAQLRVRTRQQARSSQDSEIQPDGPPQVIALIMRESNSESSLLQEGFAGLKDV